MTDRLLYSLFALSLIIESIGMGCASKQTAKAKVYTWRFNRCVKNGDHEVCECNSSHEVVDAKTGKTVTVCE